MGRTIEDLNSYLNQLDLPYEEVKPGMWVIHDEQDQVDNIFVTFSDPLVVFRVKIMDAPTNPEKKAELCEELLKINATEMIAGAYGLEGNAVVITDTLQSENLDYNEFQASVDALTMAISQHYPLLSKYQQSKN
jgi:Putative bacterial sensory transduction regulator